MPPYQSPPWAPKSDKLRISGSRQGGASHRMAAAADPAGFSAPSSPDARYSLIGFRHWLSSAHPDATERGKKDDVHPLRRGSQRGRVQLITPKDQPWQSELARTASRDEAPGISRPSDPLGKISVSSMTPKSAIPTKIHRGSGKQHLRVAPPGGHHESCRRPYPLDFHA